MTRFDDPFDDPIDTVEYIQILRSHPNIHIQVFNPRKLRILRRDYDINNFDIMYIL